MVDVFISYSRSDQAMVALLAHAVEAAGYEVWWDAELPPHQSYGDVITDKIANAKAAIVVWSASAVKSEWVRAEADMARNQRKLVQTALDSVSPPLPFNQIQYATIGDWRGEPDHPGWRKVKVSLAELCGPPGEDARPSRPIPSAPPPRPAMVPEPGPSASVSRWPLFAGIGVAVVALAAAGGMLLSQRNSAPPAAASQPSLVVPVAEAPAADGATAAAPVSAVADNDDGGDRAPAEAAAEDGKPLPKPNDADLTFPDSSTRLLTPAEVMPLGPASLRVARNEIMARKGRRFRDPWLRDWFSRYAWYSPRYNEVKLNPIEKQNVALIQQAEHRYQ